MFSMQINTTHMSWTTKTSSRMKHEMIVIQDKISAAPTHKILVIFVSKQTVKQRLQLRRAQILNHSIYLTRCANLL